eukprot:4550637-Prymnesium_polylepis.2
MPQASWGRPACVSQGHSQALTCLVAYLGKLILQRVLERDACQHQCERDPQPLTHIFPCGSKRCERQHADYS